MKDENNSLPMLEQFTLMKYQSRISFLRCDKRFKIMYWYVITTAGVRLTIESVLVFGLFDVD